MSERQIPLPILRVVTVGMFVICLTLCGCGMKFHSGNSELSTADRNKVVSTAYAQMGKRYRWGGASPAKGFDCSGLIYWTYRKNGINMPRITKDQAQMGQSVPRSMARPGDIVVFRTASGPRGLHTGIYIGNNSFIHSPRSGEKVRMESINVKYWKQKLVSVRCVMR